MAMLVELLLLLIVANGSPVLVSLLLRRRLSAPIDGGRCFWDGQRLFGYTKTWRGLVVSVLLTALVAHWFGLGAIFGAAFGLLAMVGDLLSSFIKRRFRMASSTRFIGLDQLPEALLPLMLARPVYDMSWWVVLIIAVIFMLLNMGFSPMLYRLGIRSRPH